MDWLEQSVYLPQMSIRSDACISERASTRGAAGNLRDATVSVEANSDYSLFINEIFFLNT